MTPTRRFRPRSLVALVLVAALVAAGLAAYRAYGALSGFGNPFLQAREAIAPQPGSIGWKLRHGEQVNVLLLGYGGAENDAPYLTDSMMVLSIDPASKRAVEASLPRDMSVPIDAFQNHAPIAQKINTAFEIGMDDQAWQGKKPEFTARKDRGGRLAMQTVGTVTGLHFDGYVGVDFKAFRDMVDALGGVDICLSSALDDHQYPDYHDGYIKGGIHFKAGCQHVNGEKALELARSRHAQQAEQASDFARAHRQQLIMAAIRKKATSIDAIGKAPQLLDALQKDISTNLGLADLRAVYDWSAKLPDSAIEKVALTPDNFLDEWYGRRGGCGDSSAYTLCPVDRDFKMVRAYFANLFVDPKVLGQAAPIQLANGSRTLPDMGDRVANSLQPLGFHLDPAIRVRPTEKSIVYDYSGGRYASTAQWLASYFGGTVVSAGAGTGTQSPSPNPPAGGIVVVLGHDYALRWIGQ